MKRFEKITLELPYWSSPSEDEYVIRRWPRREPFPLVQLACKRLTDHFTVVQVEDKSNPGQGTGRFDGNVLFRLTMEWAENTTA